MVEFIAFVAIMSALALGLMRLEDRNRRAKASRIADRQRQIKAIPNFSPTVAYRCPNEQYMIAIDAVSNRFVVHTPKSGIRCLTFSELVDVQLDRGEQLVTQTKGTMNAGGAAVATALVGPIGLAAGVKTRSTSVTNTKIVSVTLRVFVNSISDPIIYFPFYDTAASISNSKRFERATELGDEWCGRFRTILMMQASQASAAYMAKSTDAVGESSSIEDGRSNR